VELRFDLPGIDPESIEVTVDKGVLTVGASRTEEYAEDERPYRRERVMGSFARRVYLSDAVDSEKIDAAYAGGVLTVRLPLLEKAQPRKVEIHTDGQKEIAACGRSQTAGPVGASPGPQPSPGSACSPGESRAFAAYRR
jgi:HSP20 family protein